MAGLGRAGWAAEAVCRIPVNLPESTGDARDQVAKIVGVSGKSIDYATKVLNNASHGLRRSSGDKKKVILLPSP